MFTNVPWGANFCLRVDNRFVRVFWKKVHPGISFLLSFQDVSFDSEIEEYFFCCRVSDKNLVMCEFHTHGFHDIGVEVSSHREMYHGASWSFAEVLKSDWCCLRMKYDGKSTQVTWSSPSSLAAAWRPEVIEDFQRRARMVIAFAPVEPLGNTLDCVCVRFTCLPAPQFTLRVAAFITSATIIYVRKHVSRDKFQLPAI